MTIEPDNKDWTWVRQKPCPDCGFDASTFSCLDVAQGLRHNAAQWKPVLAQPDARRRPWEDVWSPLEYGCHVRDVFWKYNQRLSLMLCKDDPMFENWDQDQTAIETQYDKQEPVIVAREIEEAAADLAAAFDAVPEDAWTRPGRRSDGASFTIDSISRYLLHDPVHHLWDVRRG